MLEGVSALVGVVVGSLLTGAREYWLASISRRKDGEYLAIRVVSLLDGFVEGCAEVVGDDGLSYGQRDADGCRSIQASTPEISLESLEVNWKSIPARLMYEVLSLPNRIDAANHRISGAFEYDAGPPDYEEGFEERQIQYAELGLKAAALADELRKIYGVPGRDYLAWNPIEYLEQGKKRAIEAKAKRTHGVGQLMQTKHSES